MNTQTGELVRFDDPEDLPQGFVPVSDAVATMVRKGRQTIDRGARRAKNKRERQNRKNGRRHG